MSAQQEQEQEHHYPSFLDQARAVVARHPERVYATWYDVHGKATDQYTYQKLWQDAGTIAHHLQHTWGVPKGGKVVLCYNFGLHFFASFLGCLRAGVVAVLVFPPGPPLVKSLSKLVKVVEDCQPACILTDGAVSTLKRVDQLNPVSKTRSLWPSSVPYHRTDALVAKKSKKVLSFDDDSIQLNDLAFLQYTSGSTSLPKAVMVTHGNVSHNVRLLGAGHRRTLPQDCQGSDYNHVGFSWLPQYHDLGLIYASISPFAEGWTMHMMSPVSFIKNPLLWMQLISQKRIKWSVAPNFGYKLVVRKFLQAKARGQAAPSLDLDLSCVHHFMNCAEPIGLETHQEFSDCFCNEDHGLRPDWFFAGYGLAEHVVGCCFNDGHDVSRQRPEDQSRFVAVGHRDKFDRELLVKIVDPQTCQEVEDEVTGELWLSSPSKTAGYLGKPQLSQETMEGQLQGAETATTTTYLRTGDLAFFQDDLLYICGRSKDLIILQGANFYPHDFEYTAQSIDGVRPGCTAAFSPTESAEGGEEVQMVFEIRKEHEANAPAVCMAIRDAVVESLGLAPGQLVIVAIPERSICKTTSGKIQRRRTRQHLHDNLFKIVHALGKSGGTFKPDSFDDSGRTQQTHDEKANDSVNNLEGLSQEDKYDRIVAKVLGEGYNPTATWEEGGLSSMSTVELQNLLSLHFPVTLPPDFSEQYPTPNALKELVLGPSTGAFFPVELEDLKSTMSSLWNRRLAWWPSTLLQGVGVAILFVVFALATLPAYHFVQACGDHDLFFLLPLTLPVWHLSFSLLVLLSKWVVIGRYSTRQVVVPSVYFLSWWFVDRLVELWEFFTGRFLLNTPLIVVFYRLMGVHMPWTGVEVDAFLREFDLLTIEGSVSIGYDLKCRKFGPWEKASGAPTLRFRPTRIASGCTIRGHVALGATVGEGSCVERLSSLPEGAQVPSGVAAVGSPAYQIPQPAQPYVASQWLGTMGLAKVVWILVELYLSASFWMLGEAAFGSAMRAWTWRYASLAQIVLLVCFSTIVGMIACIPMKWLFVGRRQPGSSTSDLQELLHWCADYHFNIYNGLFKVVAENTVMTNLFLMALGMDIDWESKVWLFILPPSKVDLVTVKRSFVSTATFDVVQNGQAQRVVIEDASIGHSLVLVGGAAVRYTEVVPFSRVTGDLIGDAKKWEETHEKLYSVSRRLWVDVAVLPVTLCIAATFIPTYEFMSSNVFGTVVPGMSFPVLKLALGLMIHCATWYVCGVLLHWTLYVKEKGGKSFQSQPWSPVLFAIYMTVMSEYWEHSFLALTWGTTFFNAVLVGMGARIKAPLWFFGKRFYDLPLIEINGPTIVDSSWANGHSVVGGKIELGECVISGVIHERSIFLANAHIAPGNGEKEYGPMIHYVSSASATDKEDAVSDFEV